MGYDQERQIAIAGRVGRSQRWQWLRWDLWQTQARLLWESGWRNVDWARVAVWLVGVVGLGFCAARLPRLRIWWRSRRQKQRALSGQADPSDATVLYLHMAKLLKRQGMERPTWMTPSEFAATQGVRQRAPLVANVTAAYNDLRFGNHQESAGRLAELLSGLEASLRP